MSRIWIVGILCWLLSSGIMVSIQKAPGSIPTVATNIKIKIISNRLQMGVDQTPETLFLSYASQTMDNIQHNIH